jgi:hypothetical protein
MTAPPAIGRGEAPVAGGTSSTNFSPNSVLGSRRAETLAGICGTIAGSRASRSVAPRPSAVISRTSPTMTPRSFTSAPGLSCMPTWSARSDTQVTGVNALR